MGGGTYSYNSAVERSVSKGYASESWATNAHGMGLVDAALVDDYRPTARADIFIQRRIHNEMDPHGVTVRESRDSEEHPESLAIIIGLDVTGSMGRVPHHLLGEGFPNLMNKIIQAGVKDPQVLFVAIGDHTCDEAPLQVGQFESSDELLEKWLTSVYLEGHGGANAGESYLLAWYFAAMHTSIDCWEKRKQKGILFTIGDEPPLKDLPESAVKNIMGLGQAEKYDGHTLLEKARETYNVFHIHIQETHRGRNPDSIEDWGQLLGDDLLMSQHHDDVADTISDKILEVLDKEPPPQTKDEAVDGPDGENEEKDEKKRPPNML